MEWKDTETESESDSESERAGDGVVVFLGCTLGGSRGPGRGLSFLPSRVVEVKKKKKEGGKRLALKKANRFFQSSRGFTYGRRLEYFQGSSRDMKGKVIE